MTIHKRRQNFSTSPPPSYHLITHIRHRFFTDFWPLCSLKIWPHIWTPPNNLITWICLLHLIEKFSSVRRLSESWKASMGWNVFWSSFYILMWLYLHKKIFMVKFKYWDKASKFGKIFLFVLTSLNNVKKADSFFPIFVAYSENLDFKYVR